MKDNLKTGNDKEKSTDMRRRAALVRAGKALAYAAPVTLITLKVDAAPCSVC